MRDFSTSHLPQDPRSPRMAEYGEWNRKGAVLSDVTAQKEYGVTRDFIVKGVQAGELEFREGAVWGNPYLRVLSRSFYFAKAQVIAPARSISGGSGMLLATAWSGRHQGDGKLGPGSASGGR